MSQEHWKYLCEAAAKGSVDKVQDYIDAGVDVNITRKGTSALSIAAFNSNWDCVKVLLDAGANVNFVDGQGETPFFDACGWGTKDIIKACIEAGADVNIANKYTSPLCRVACREIVMNVSYIGCSSPSFHKKMELATYNENLDIAKILLDAGANVNFKTSPGETPLFLAAVKNHTDIAQAFIDAGADVNVIVNGQTALHRATQSDSWKMVKILIDAGADINLMNSSEWVPLHYAAEHGPADIVKAFVDAGVDVNEMYKGESALCLASRVHKWMNVKILLDAGACVNIFDSLEWTPLCYAASSAPTYIIRAFIQAGADVNTRSHSHWALELATEGKMWENVKILIDAGADVNVIACFHPNPLFYAAMEGRIDVIMHLIKAGANIFNKKGHGPSDLYYLSESRNCSKVLIKYALLKHKSVKLNRPINTKLSSFWNKCEKQVGIMEKVKLKCRLSLCEYLLETDANKLALSWSAENTDSKSIFARQKGKYLEKFSAYAEDIKAQFNKGKERACLLLESMNCFSTILPEEIRRKICELMTNDDLKNFSSSIKINSSSKVTHSEISVFIKNSNVLFLNSDGENGSVKEKRRGRKRKLEYQ